MLLTQRALAIMIVSLFTPALAYAQEAIAVQETVRTDDAPVFFTNYVNKGIKPKRDPEETDAQYKARSQQQWDTKRIVYLEMQARLLGQAFEYDTIAQKLTLYVGDDFSLLTLRDAMSKSLVLRHSTGFPVVVHEAYAKTGEYTSKNASIKKKVEKTTTIDYVALITNTSRIPSTLYTKQLAGVVLTPSFACPRDEVRKLVFDPLTTPIDVEIPAVPPLEVIGAFKMHAYQKSGMGVDRLEPTRDSPIDHTETIRWIEADLVGLTVRNRATKKVYAEYTFDTDIFTNDAAAQQ